MDKSKTSAQVTGTVDARDLLRELANFYHYDMEIEDGSIVMMPSQDNDKALILEYDTPEQAVGDWLPSMLGTNQAYMETGQAQIWSDAEIAFALKCRPAPSTAEQNITAGEAAGQ